MGTGSKARGKIFDKSSQYLGGDFLSFSNGWWQKWFQTFDSKSSLGYKAVNHPELFPVDNSFYLFWPQVSWKSRNFDRFANNSPDHFWKSVLGFRNKWIRKRRFRGLISVIFTLYYSVILVVTILAINSKLQINRTKKNLNVKSLCPNNKNTMSLL